MTVRPAAREMPIEDSSMAYACKSIAVKVDRGVAFATMNNPPINILTLELCGEVMPFPQEVAKDDAIRAVVLRSDDPDCWLAHVDVAAIVDFPADGVAPLHREVSNNWYHAMCETSRTMPRATIAEISGRVGGGGSERGGGGKWCLSPFFPGDTDGDGS